MLVVEAEAAGTGGGCGLSWFTDPADGACYLLYNGYPTEAPGLWPCFDQPDLTATTTLSLALPAAGSAQQRAGDRAAAGSGGGNMGGSGRYTARGRTT